MTVPSLPASGVAAVDPAPLAMTLREKISFGAGDFAISVTWTFASAFLLLYWSDVALIPVMALGPLMLIVRVLDAVFDPIVGILVDRTRTRWGKARPYLLWAAVPFALLSVACFTIPNLSPQGKIAYAYVAFITFGFCYSLLYIPYGSMLPMLTRQRSDKVQLASFRSMGTSIASIIVYATALPLVALVNPVDRQAGFTVAAALFGTLSIVFIVGGTFRNCRERFSDVALPQVAATPLRVAMRQIVRNPLWRIACGIAISLLIKMFTMVSSFVYFSRDVLGDAAWVTRVLPFVSVAILLGGLTASIWLRRIGLRAGNLLTIGSALLLACAMPFFEGQPVPFFGLFLLSQFGGAFQAATIFILIAEAVDLQETRHGLRSEGLMTSSVAFSTKLGMAIGTSLTAFVLGWTHYHAGQPTAQSVTAIRWLFYGSQILCLVLMGLFISRYRRAADLSGDSA